MILSSRLASADDVGRFHAEAKAAGSLRHPNIVAIHDAGEVHGQHFFAMDFVEGRSLAQALAAGAFEPKQAAECLAAIGKAVQYLHEHHIIHRDLKPSNILLAPDGTPFVTDFGLAKALAFDSPHTETGTMVGTLGYMPPEQTLGEPATPRSDVYSLGAILFEMLTGRPPFQNASPFDTLMQVMEEDPPACGSSTATCRSRSSGSRSSASKRIRTTATSRRPLSSTTWRNFFAATRC